MNGLHDSWPNIYQNIYYKTWGLISPDCSINNASVAGKPQQNSNSWRKQGTKAVVKFSCRHTTSLTPFFLRTGLGPVLYPASLSVWDSRRCFSNSLGPTGCKHNRQWDGSKKSVSQFVQDMSTSNLFLLHSAFHFLSLWATLLNSLEVTALTFSPVTRHQRRRDLPQSREERSWPPNHEDV